MWDLWRMMVLQILEQQGHYITDILLFIILKNWAINLYVFKKLPFKNLVELSLYGIVNNYSRVGGEGGQVEMFHDVKQFHGPHWN